jgi:peptidoglycan endopeptidase LytE
LSEAVTAGANVVPRVQKPGAVLRRAVMAFFIVLLAVALVGVAGPSSVEAKAAKKYAFPTGTAHRGSQAAKMLAVARHQLGKQYKFGATGMTRFDCSGYVYRVFKNAGLVNKIGGGRRGATGYWRWFKQRGQASRSNPRPGDLIIWLKGGHIGIYIGKGMAVDATPSRGVGVRPLNGGWSSQHFTTFLHVRMSR